MLHRECLLSFTGTGPNLKGPILHMAEYSLSRVRDQRFFLLARLNSLVAGMHAKERTL
jgi:hypothetical protein